jgi:hypothetical protein
MNPPIGYPPKMDHAPSEQISKPFPVQKYSAVRTGFVFEVAIAAGPKVFSAGVAVTGAAPVLGLERRGTAFGTAFLDFPYEIVVAVGTKQFFVKYGRGNRHENEPDSCESEPGDEQPGERWLEKQKGIKHRPETQDNQD